MIPSSSDDSNDDSEDDDDSIDNESGGEGTTEDLTGAVSAVSTLLASLGQDSREECDIDTSERPDSDIKSSLMERGTVSRVKHNISDSASENASSSQAPAPTSKFTSTRRKLDINSDFSRDQSLSERERSAAAVRSVVIKGCASNFFFRIWFKNINHEKKREETSVRYLNYSGTVQLHLHLTTEWQENALVWNTVALTMIFSLLQK